MLAIASALAAAAVLGLVFESTRWIGIVCAGLLIYVFPISTLTILAIAGAVYFFLHH